MSVADPPVDFERTLRERFGLEQFRAGQREVIEQVISRRDVLCVMPTGGGKSLCYQLPALLLDGLTLVVSPLIALMKDQVDVLQQRGIRATLLNSTLDPDEQRLRLQEIEAGRYDLVYVAPERFRSPRFVEAMGRVKPALLAIDEAHCISEWGHDFRPDYAKIGQARRALGFPPCIALTATATDLVRRDIADQLDLQDPAQFVTGFDRPNLRYGVIEARRDEDKLAALARLLDETPGPAIVYASSRDRCKNVGIFLEKELRRSTVVYHAGLGRDERSQAQDRFMSGEAEIVVATNAFGMGVDKANIRSVVHFNMPGTLEAYYQEAGRAGRDGGEAQCVLLYAPGDRKLQELFIENEYPPRDAIYRIYEFLRMLDADPIELTHAEIRESGRIEVGESAIGTALKILEGAGAIERFLPRENMAIVRINVEPGDPSLVERVGSQAHVQRIVLLGIEGLVNRKYGETIYFHPDGFAASLGLERTALTRALKALSADLPIDYVPPFRGNAIRVINRNRRSKDVDIDFPALEVRKRREYDKLERMVRYAQSGDCRRAMILGYFGDTNTIHCGHCDNCEGKGGSPSTTRASIDTDAGREVLLKALSGVARAKGRFGKTVVAQMLTGSKSEKLTKFGLDQLSTFGILNAFTQPEVMQVLDSAARAGLIESQDVDNFRPIVVLSESGRSFLKEPKANPLDLELPTDLASKVRLGGLGRKESRGPSTATDEPRPEPDDLASLKADPLWNRLRDVRTNIARAEKVPPHVIFPDSTLMAIVREAPRQPHDLIKIKGMSPLRMERCGQAILDAIHGFGTPDPEPAPSPSAPSVARAPRIVDASSATPTEIWSWRLLDRGFSATEAAAIRGVAVDVILRHIKLAARQGKAVPIEACLPSETLDAWRAWHAEHGSTPPPDADDRPEAWSLFLIALG
jgi:ATP-dependent DNA helicase RecQ